MRFPPEHVVRSSIAPVLLACALSGCHVLLPYGAPGADGPTVVDHGQDRSAESGRRDRDGQELSVDAARTCQIEGKIRLAGEGSSGDPCRICDPAFSTALWAPAPGCITTLVGTGVSPECVVRAAYTSQLRMVHGLAYGGGILYLSEDLCECILALDLATGQLTALAGCGAPPLVSGPKGMRAVNGKLYIAEMLAHRVSVLDLSTRKFDPPLSVSPVTLVSPYDVEIVNPGPAQTVYVADFDRKIIKVDGTGGSYVTSLSTLYEPEVLTSSGPDAIFAADYWQVFRFSPTTPPTVVAGIAGCSTSKLDCLSHPQGLATNQGQLFIADTHRHRLLVMTPAGSPQLLAGTPDQYGARDGLLPQSSLHSPKALVYAGGYLFVADELNAMVRVLRP